MSDSNASRAKHKSILASLSALGPSEFPVTTNSVPRNSVIASVAAAGVSLLACQYADAGEHVCFSRRNVSVGFAAGDVSSFRLSIASLSPGFKLAKLDQGLVHAIDFKGTTSPNNANFHIKTTHFILAPGGYGRKFSQIGAGASTPLISLACATAGGFKGGADFSREYYAFSFLDASALTHYGWIYGALSGVYSDMSYNVISWAYDTTPGEQIGMGFTGASTPEPSTPEPSTFVLDAMAALILGAAGVRRRNTARAQKVIEPPLFATEIAAAPSY